MKKTLLLLLLLMHALHTYPQKGLKEKAGEQTHAWRYEIECAGIAPEGTKLLKVWSYSRKPSLAILQAKKNAIHGVIFKGYAGNAATGCPAQNPLVRNDKLAEEKSAFFAEFFADGGNFMQFVSVSNEGVATMQPGDRVKIGKEYKIAVVVTVAYAQLRKYLEKQGIARILTEGF